MMVSVLIDILLKHKIETRHTRVE